jgi:surface antigen Omp85-like protein
VTGHASLAPASQGSEDNDMIDRPDALNPAVRRILSIAGVSLALIATTRIAIARPPTEAAQPCAAGPLLAAEPVIAAAPTADQASGVLVPDAGADPPWIWAPRALLFPLRAAVQIGFAPLRGAAWVVDRYRLRDRIAQLLFSDDGTLGVYPTALFATGLGLNVGAHVLARDLAGHGERMSLSAGYGGELNQRHDASLSSGSLFGPTVATARASFRAWDRYNYFGIGNSTSAVPVQLAQHVWNAELAARRRVARPLAIQLVAAYSARRLDRPAASAGFGRAAAGTRVGRLAGTHHAYGELGVALDTTAYASRYISRANPSTGWLASAFVGATQGAAGDPSHYLRYGVEARRFLDVYRGDRVLVLYAALQGVTARLDAIPLVDLPRLGGEVVLRGFPDDRFRDRVTALGSAEYQFPIQDGATAFGFVDAGQVADAPSRLALRAWHVGAGGGLQFQTPTSFLFRLQVATSADGTFVELAFDPGRDVHARQRRL